MRAFANDLYGSSIVPPPNYREDIDGLRALAVLPVCLFHAGLPGFAGGFVGVDVFFVISGYLMMRIVAAELDVANGRFSLTAFYERRLRRILPALFVMLFACTICAAIAMPPKLFSNFASTLIGTLLFASNILFWRSSSNYFDATTDWSPLLHVWSLSVEEQFYIAFPLIIIGIWRLQPRERLGAILTIAAASLLLSVWGAANAPTATFYLLPTRAWEFLAGGLVAMWPVRTQRCAALESAQPNWLENILSVAGIAFIVSSFILIDSETPFPGAAAVPACLGAVMLLGNSNQLTLGARALSAAPLRFVGKTSYSLYLWHWPILVFASKYFVSRTLGSWERVALLILAGTAAWLSWRWIERPFRRRNSYWTFRRLAVSAAAGSLALGLFGGFAIVTQGWPGRFPGIQSVSLERQLLADDADPIWKNFHHNRCFVVQVSDWKADSCLLTNSDGISTLLWGDSFADNYAYGLLKAGSSRLSILEYTSPQCPPILGYAAASRPQCERFDADASVKELVAEHRVTTIIMAANWASYIRRHKLSFADIRSTVTALEHLGLRVIVVGQSPIFSFAYPDAFYYIEHGTSRVAVAYARLDLKPNFNSQIVAYLPPGTLFFDPLLAICRDRDCIYKEGDSYLFVDYGHFTAHGSQLIAGALLGAIDRSSSGTPSAMLRCPTGDATDPRSLAIDSACAR